MKMRDKLLVVSLTLILLAILLAALVGCAQHGFIKVHVVDEEPGRKTTRTTEVRQPPGAIAPASLDMEFEPVDGMDATAKADAENPGFWASLFGAKKPEQVATTQPVSVPKKMSIKASTGAGQPLDQALAQLSNFPMIGIAICAIGVLMMAAKFWFPLWPLEYGVYTILFGITIMAFPTLLDRYAWVIGVILIAFLGYNVYRQNKTEKTLKEKVGGV